MTEYLLIYQSGGGSTYEAMCIDRVFGPYDTRQDAADAAERLTAALSAVSSMHADEGITQIIEVPATPPTERDAAVQAYIDKETEYWTS